jgi:hypothetical protein
MLSNPKNIRPLCTVAVTLSSEKQSFPKAKPPEDQASEDQSLRHARQMSTAHPSYVRKSEFTLVAFNKTATDVCKKYNLLLKP